MGGSSVGLSSTARSDTGSIDDSEELDCCSQSSDGCPPEPDPKALGQNVCSSPQTVPTEINTSPENADSTQAGFTFSSKFDGSTPNGPTRPYQLGSHSGSSLAGKLPAAAINQIKACFDNNTPLVSFAGKKGFENCIDRIDPVNGDSNNSAKTASKRPSPIEHLLMVLGSGGVSNKTVQIGEGLTVECQVLVFNKKNGLPVITGTLALVKTTVSGEETNTVPFLLMAPDYDRKSVPADQLVQCFESLQNIREAGQQSQPEQADTTGASEHPPSLFTSGMGKGRAAALLVMDEFNKRLDSGGARNEIDVAESVDQIIRQVRDSSSKLGNGTFLNQPQMRSEVIEACKKILDKRQPRPAEQQDLVQTRGPEEQQSSAPADPDGETVAQPVGATNTPNAEPNTAPVNVRPSSKDKSRSFPPVFSFFNPTPGQNLQAAANENMRAAAKPSRHPERKVNEWVNRDEISET